MNRTEKFPRFSALTTLVKAGGAHGRLRGATRHVPALDVLEDRLVLSPGTVSLGTAAEYGVLGLANTRINNSNVTIHGDAGVSQGGTLANMAPSTITGTAYESAANQYSGPGHLGGGAVIDSARMAQADQDALNASSQAAALTATQTLGSINSPTTVTGNGGLNVIAINGSIKSSLILTGTSSDVFIVNVTGGVTLTGSTVLGLGGGATADRVLYNFTGKGISIGTHVGNVLNGTLLAPYGNFNLDGVFNGAIIGGGGSIALLSGATVNEIDFSGPTATATAELSGSVTGPGFTPIVGVPVTLTGTDDLGNAVTLTVSTDSQGVYDFQNLAPGTYTVEQPQQSGVFFNMTQVGTDNGVTDGVVDSDGNIAQIVLVGGDVATRYNFGSLGE